jgi:hypothetical protein
VEVKKMRYLISVDTPTEISSALLENPEESRRTMEGLFAQLKPEAAYFSTIRRAATFVVNVEDPHVGLRRIYETFSKFGKVTVDPVSTKEEFFRFFEKM